MKAFSFSIAMTLTCLTVQAEPGPYRLTQTTAMSEAAQATLQALEKEVGTVEVDQNELTAWGSTPVLRYRLTTHEGRTAVGGTQAFDQAWQRTLSAKEHASMLARAVASSSGYRATELVIALADMAALTHPHQLQRVTDDEAQLTYYEGRALEVAHAWRLFELLQARMPKQAHYTGEGYVTAFANALASIDEADLVKARNASEESLDALAELNVSYTKGATTWSIPGLTIRERGQEPSLQVSLVATSKEADAFDDSLVDIIDN